MHLSTYAQTIEGFARYPQEVGTRYARLGLIGEAGEIANQVKKIWRDDDGLVTDDRCAKLVDELGDVLWYAVRLAHHLGVDVGQLEPVIGDTEVFSIIDFEVTDIFTATERLLLVAAAPLALPLDVKRHEKVEFVQELLNAIADMADYLDADIDELAQLNVDKLNGRIERGTLQGSGDGR